MPVAPHPMNHDLWRVDLRPVGGPLIEPGFARRDDAQAVERDWLDRRQREIQWNGQPAVASPENYRLPLEGLGAMSVPLILGSLLALWGIWCWLTV